GAERPGLTERKAVQNGAHGMLADAEVKIPAAVTAGLEISRPIEGKTRLGGRREIGSAADQPGHIRSQRIQPVGGRPAAGQALGISRKDGEILVPAVRKLAALHAVQMIGELGMIFGVAVKHLLPCDAKLAPAPAKPVREMLANAGRHKKLCVLGPAIIAL